MLHQLKISSHLRVLREGVISFFADAGNLARITPPDLNFSILTPLPVAMEVGTLIQLSAEAFRSRVRLADIDQRLGAALLVCR
jgi:hypothetical protein